MTVLFATKSKNLAALAAGFLLHTFSLAAFGDAAILLSERYIEIAKGKHSETFLVMNSGDSPGRYELSLQDRRQRPDGRFARIKEPDNQSLSAYFRLSPRRFTLNPGEHQLVRIRGSRKTMAAATEGEYFSHLVVLLADKNVASELAPEQETPQAVMRVGQAVPVVWKNYDTNTEPKPEITINELSENSVKITVERKGLGSVRAYAHWGVIDNKGLVKKLDATPVILLVYSNLETAPAHINLPPKKPKDNLVLLVSKDYEGSVPLLKPIPIPNV